MSTSTLKKFSLSCGMDFSMDIEIDTSILTPEYANEIARFWGSSQYVLKVSGGDAYQAVARYAAARLWWLLMDGFHDKGAVSELHEQEGWCIPGESLGIRILSYDIPDFDPEELDVMENA